MLELANLGWPHSSYRLPTVTHLLIKPVHIEYWFFCAKNLWWLQRINKGTCYAIEFLRIACIGWCNVVRCDENNAFLVLRGDICVLY